LAFRQSGVGVVGWCYTNSSDIAKREVATQSWPSIEEKAQDHQIWSWGEVPHQVSWFRVCVVLGLYHANTLEIVILKIPFRVKVVITLVGHVGKISCLVLVFTWTLKRTCGYKCEDYS
jgi:hypothetical protein